LNLARVQGGLITLRYFIFTFIRETRSRINSALHTIIYRSCTKKDLVTNFKHSYRCSDTEPWECEFLNTIVHGKSGEIFHGSGKVLNHMYPYYASYRALYARKRNFDFIGTIEDFDYSLTMVNKLLKIHGRNFSLNVKLHKNVRSKMKSFTACDFATFTWKHKEYRLLFEDEEYQYENIRKLNLEWALHNDV